MTLTIFQTNNTTTLKRRGDRINPSKFRTLRTNANQNYFKIPDLSLRLESIKNLESRFGVWFGFVGLAILKLLLVCSIV